MNKRIPVLTVMGVVVLVTALWQIYHVGDIISDMVLLKKSKIMSDKLGKIEEEANDITKMIKQKLNK